MLFQAIAFIFKRLLAFFIVEAFHPRDSLAVWKASSFEALFRRIYLTPIRKVAFAVPLIKRNSCFLDRLAIETI